MNLISTFPLRAEHFLIQRFGNAYGHSLFENARLLGEPPSGSETEKK